MEGYFSSNRLGSMYLSPEDEACCFDIYHFEKPPLKDRIILVRTFETYKGLNPQPLNGVKVTLAEQVPGVLADIREDYLSNLYFYKLLRDRDVNVTGTKKGYKPGFNDI